MRHLVQYCPPFLYVATFTITLLFLYKLFIKNKPPPNLPPSPPKLPIIGNLHQLGSQPHQSLQAISKTYGPIMLLHFGYVPTVVVSSANVARVVMKDQDLVFASRPPLSMAKGLLYGCDVAFSPYGEYWRQVRKISVIHLLSLKAVQSFQSIREEEVSIFINKIRASCNGVMNLSDMIVNLTNNVVCRAAFGKTYFGEEYDFKELMEEFTRLLGEFPFGDFIPWLGWIDRLSGLNARVKRTFRALDGFLDKVLDDVREKTSGDGKGSNFVDMLHSLHEKDGISLTRDNIKAIILDMFAAGTHTTFTLMTWTMAELIRNPRTMKRVQEEIRGVFTSSNQTITEDNINKMNYLQAVIKETLRLHPPLPLLAPRETMEDAQLEGYHIPARTRVIINAWAIGRDPQSWDRPEEFYPERFLNCNVDFKGQDFELVPFGAGRRVCPGIAFTAAVFEPALAHLLCHFDWELPDGRRGEEIDMSEGAKGITIHIKSSLILVAKPRFLP